MGTEIRLLLGRHTTSYVCDANRDQMQPAALYASLMQKIRPICSERN